MQIMHEIIHDNISKAHDLSAQKYNLRSRQVKFYVDQEVYFRTFPQSDFKNNFNYKFAPKFLKGRVLKVVGDNRYEIGNLKGKSIGIYHTKDLKQ